MQVRFSTALGIACITRDEAEILGQVNGILVHPDTAKVEGFFIANKKGILPPHPLFLSSLDIIHWGVRITVRGHEVLTPLDDRVRLQPLLEDPRTILGQRIRTEKGLYLGRCRDVQFDTEHFMIEWLFPKKFFRWGIALPISEVLEVRPDAIIVRDRTAPAKEKTEKAPILGTLPEAA